MATISTLILIPVLLFILLIPLILGIYVYKDAKARDMNPALWTFIAVFVPSLMGFIAYLIVRGNYSGYVCPNCGGSVEKNYSACPKCGTKLRPLCPECSYPVEPDWKVCPRCTSPLNITSRGIHAPVKKRDTGLGKIIAIVVAVPLFLFLAILIFSVSGYSRGGAMNTFSVEAETYLADKNDERISTWFNNCGDDYNKAYVLQYLSTHGENKASHYIVYIPFADEETSFGTAPSSSLFSTPKLKLSLEGSGIGKGGYIFGVSTYDTVHRDLEIIYNGEKLETEISEINFNPMLFEIVGEEVE